MYYKNILLSLSNGINSMRVSKQNNSYSGADALFLGYVCHSIERVVARNGRKYYYFSDCIIEPEVVQFLLNQNGVLAYRRYSAYASYYVGRKYLVRVPFDFVDSNSRAALFMKKVLAAQKELGHMPHIDVMQYLDLVHSRMK